MSFVAYKKGPHASHDDLSSEITENPRKQVCVPAIYGRLWLHTVVMTTGFLYRPVNLAKRTKIIRKRRVSRYFDRHLG